jgi:hypothetical protein
MLSHMHSRWYDKQLVSSGVLASGFKFPSALSGLFDTLDYHTEFGPWSFVHDRPFYTSLKAGKFMRKTSCHRVFAP